MEMGRFSPTFKNGAAPSIISSSFHTARSNCSFFKAENLRWANFQLFGNEIRRYVDSFISEAGDLRWVLRFFHQEGGFPHDEDNDVLRRNHVADGVLGPTTEPMAIFGPIFAPKIKYEGGFFVLRIRRLSLCR